MRSATAPSCASLSRCAEISGSSVAFSTKLLSTDSFGQSLLIEVVEGKDKCSRVTRPWSEGASRAFKMPCSLWCKCSVAWLQGAFLIDSWERRVSTKQATTELIAYYSLPIGFRAVRPTGYLVCWYYVVSIHSTSVQDSLGLSSLIEEAVRGPTEETLSSKLIARGSSATSNSSNSAPGGSIPPIA
jgi:hypothetical protein